MNDYDLTYEWLDFMALQKSRRKKIIKEVDLQPKKQCPVNYPLAASAVSSKWSSLWGDLCYKEGMGGDIEIDPEWVAENIVDINVGGRTIKVNKIIKDILPKAYEEAVKASGYAPTIGGKVGPWHPRHVKLGGIKPGISGHSWGMAIDFDPAANDPQGNKEAIIKSHPEFINKMKENGFAWLAEDDPMHFYYNINTAKNQQLFTSTNSSDTDAKDFSYDIFSGRSDADSTETGNFLGQILRKENIDREIKLFKFEDNTNKNLYKRYQKYFDSLLRHLRKELDINKPVKIVLEDDKENGKKVLGRTGGYINHDIKIHIFCSGRHIKDIMRSLSHEMVHHHQNLRGEFKKHEPTSKGYAQSNKHLRKMEEEAYLKGNILFRDWEDNYKYRGEK